MRHTPILGFVFVLSCGGGSSGDGAGAGRDGGNGVSPDGAVGAGFCPHTPSFAALPAAATNPGKSLAGSAAPLFPQCTGGFSISSPAVVGTGVSSAAAGGDFFYGEAGVAYDVHVMGGAQLATFVDNRKGSPDPTTNAGASNTPNHEVIAMSAGTLINDGALATYPDKAGDTTRNYNQTSPVVFVDNDAAHPTTVTNHGAIGVKLTGAFGTADPLSGYGQENATGVFVAGAGSIVNGPTGVIYGFNAIFTMGSGTIENQGLIVAVNDGVLGGYTVTNREGAGINTTPAGFACIHAYGNVNNYGYMLGSDYGLLVDGKGIVINDYGGALLAGVTNFDGSPVYDGEVSALPRSTNKPNDNGPYLAADAMMLDGDGITINLIARNVGGTLYLPVIVGPMVGGFNGTFNSKTDNKKNTLNFQLDGISASDATAFGAALTASAKTNAFGTYYSGTFTLMGVKYHWEDFAHVAFTGTPK